MTEGIALNITLVSYDTQVDFGIIACRRSLPQIQRMIDYLEDSLVELEDAAGISSAGAKPKAKTNPRAKPKLKAKSGQKVTASKKSLAK